ncbi:UbiA prenyltransferase family [Artemisia annua]|uniref:UbiA prenyltransferase family n=1 Tax=Artemisia annua TaxID=35608 RepID=A0A2U1QID9_ARTAN|nr:UbiA prenyltransferase family [Artemisia annua]
MMIYNTSGLESAGVDGSKDAGGSIPMPKFGPAITKQVEPISLASPTITCSPFMPTSVAAPKVVEPLANLSNIISNNSSVLEQPITKFASTSHVDASQPIGIDNVVLDSFVVVKVPNMNHNESTNNLHKRKVNVVSEYSRDAQDSRTFVPKINGKTLGATLDVIYRYSRAYTLKGTILSIISISLLAVQSYKDFTPSFLVGVLQAVIGGCLANLYVAGSNQLSDIHIDKVNKPHLPLPSGELSVESGLRITSVYAILGFCLGWGVESWHLRLCIFLWYAVGTAYSVNLPLLRWKRYPVLVAMCSWSFQGVLFPMLFHLHAQTCLHRSPLSLSKHAIFVFGIMSIHSTVLVIFKDIPDVDGDKIDGIDSFPCKFGPKPVFWTCIWLLECVYGVAILTGLSSTNIWVLLIMVFAHSILGFILWRKANLVDLKNNEAIESFYLFIWKLYCVEYLLVPFLRF